MVRLVFLIYLLAIFEGSLRKWVLPQFSQYLFFIRDPVLIVAYAIAARHGLWPRGQMLFAASLWLAGLGLLWAALQAATGAASDLRLILGAYGWRAYFLYVPLAFLVGNVFRQADLLRLLKLTLWLAVPIGALVMAQFFSPPGAIINIGNAAEEELQFHGLGLNAERTRPMGPFSSGAGQQQFTATACAIALAYFIAPRRIRQPPFLLLAFGAGGVLTAVALSGSRGTVLQCGLSLVFALGLAVLGRGNAVRARALVWPVALALVLPPVLAGRAAISRFSFTLRLPKMPRPSGTYAMPRRDISCGEQPVTSWPATWIEPVRGLTMPMIVLSKVLLPMPLRPIRPTVSPRATQKLKSRRMWLAP